MRILAYPICKERRELRGKKNEAPILIGQHFHYVQAYIIFGVNYGRILTSKQIKESGNVTC